jgi:hypothetical protein
VFTWQIKYDEINETSADYNSERAKTARASTSADKGTAGRVAAALPSGEAAAIN